LYFGKFTKKTNKFKFPIERLLTSDINIIKILLLLNKFAHINILSKDNNSKDFDKILLESINNFDIITITEFLGKKFLFGIDDKFRNFSKALFMELLKAFLNLFFLILEKNI
jgi:hypothetical protein